MRVVSKLRECEQKKVKYEGRHEGEGRLTQNEEEKMQINMGLETVSLISLMNVLYNELPLWIITVSDTHRHTLTCPAHSYSGTDGICSRFSILFIDFREEYLQTDFKLDQIC